jgi:putative oxidoreductase
MRDTNEINHWIKTHGDIALDLVRIYLGLGLMIKAVYFMNHTDYLLHYMDTMGSMWFLPALMVQYVVLAHLFGGLCLTVGLITRGAALIQLPILLVAMFAVHLPHIITSVEARQSLEFAGLVFFLLFLISIYGAGRWSLDYLLGRKQNATLFRPEPEPTKS